jgi:hypothetical protein
MFYFRIVDLANAHDGVIDVDLGPEPIQPRKTVSHAVVFGTLNDIGPEWRLK